MTKLVLGFVIGVFLGPFKIYEAVSGLTEGKASAGRQNEDGVSGSVPMQAAGSLIDDSLPATEPNFPTVPAPYADHQRHSPMCARMVENDTMDKGGAEEIRDFWNRVADDWQIQVGTSGDSNRVLNSDPVLWAFAGSVSGLKLLDAGCGTGYLSKQASDRGARVTGVDISERMIEIARAQHPSIDFRVDSCSELRTIADAEFDLVIANYVLMDTPDLDGTMHAFSRVLRNRPC